MNCATQSELILAHLKERPITPLEALDLYGCFRLGARVWDLKQEGHAIQMAMIEQNGKRFAQYSIVSGVPAPS